MQQDTALDVLASALHPVGTAVMITDARPEIGSARIAYVNPAWEQLTGYAAAEAVGRTPGLLHGPETSAEVLAHLRASLRASGAAQDETTHYRRDGTPFLMAVAISPLHLAGEAADHYLILQWDVSACREEQARNRKLEALNRLQWQVTTAWGLDVEQLRQRVAEAAREVTRADWAVVEEAEGPEVVYRAAAGTAEGQRGQRLPMSDSASGLAFRTGEPVLIRDAEGDEWAEITTRMRELGYRSGVLVPLVQDGRTYGVLKVYAARAEHFDAWDQSLLGLASGVLAANLHKAAEHASAERRRALLLDALPALISYVDSDLRYQEINAAYEAFYGLRREQFLGHRLSEILEPGDFERLQPYLDAVLRGEAVSYQQEAPSSEAEPRLYQGEYLPHHGQDGEVLGFYTIVRDVTEQHEAQTDYLTGLRNRRKFEREGGLQIAQVQRYGKALSLVMIDLDHFKAINDHRGHQAGDQILEGVARLLQEDIREADLAGRWGGEEFVLLLPETPLSGALEMAERLRGHVEAHDFGVTERVTASFGAAQARSDDTLESLQARADEALYRAKEAGRNRVSE